MRIWARLDPDGTFIAAYSDRQEAQNNSRRYGKPNEVIASGTFAMDKMMPAWDDPED